MLPWARFAAVAPKTIARRNLFSCDISLAALSKSPSSSFVGLAPVCAMGLCRAAIKVSTFLNSKRLVMNIANDMRL
jgi:hypothetical protein